MTPREYYVECSAARERQRDESDREVALAWRTAAFCAGALVGKLPSLKEALAQSHGQSGQQTVDQQLAALTTISETTGIPFREASPETLAKLRLRAN